MNKIKDIGQEILILRANVGWTQQLLAEKLDISQRTVAAWESGESIPRKTMQVKIAQLFGLSTDYFLGSDLVDTNNNSETLGYSENKLIDAVDDAITKAGIDVSDEKKKQISDSIQEILEVKK